MLKCWVAVVLWAATSCSALESLPWWRTATFYQLFPRSFKDSDGDGTGDLKGIAQQADYFKELGVDAIWMNPIYKSPMADFGYDISNFTEIEPIFGTMQDFEELVAKLKELGVKLVMDFVPNHTSDEHEWFQMSVNTSHPLHQDYKDFYVWRDAKGFTPGGIPIPPNNWMTIFGGPTWTWCKERNRFYFHHFLSKQPDLNLRNPIVLDNITEIMNFWLDKGVDGFRVDAVSQLIEDANFTDEPPLPGTSGDSWFTLNHTKSMDQPETLELLRVWADLLYQRSLRDKKSLAQFLEVYGSVDLVTKYYGTGQESFQIPFNYRLMSIGSLVIEPATIKETIDHWMLSMPKGGAANWALGNHDNMRVSSRYGAEMVDTMNLVTGILPGVQCVFYGEEIGMSNTPLTYKQTVDPLALNMGPDHYQDFARDATRTPMQWDDTFSAGFSSNASTWLPVNPNYWWLNVAAQRAAPVSHLKVFQAVAKARKDPVLQRGDLEVLAPDEKTLLIIRTYNGSYYVLLANLGSNSSTFTTENLFSSLGLDTDMSVVVASVNSGYQPGTHFKKGSASVSLRPKAAILLRSRSSHIRSSPFLLIFISISSLFLSLIKSCI